MLVIEHNMDIIKSTDRLIDTGPEGGAKGEVAMGTPDDVARNPASYRQVPETGAPVENGLNRP